MEQTGSSLKALFNITMEMAAAHSESSCLLESLILAGPHIVPAPPSYNLPTSESGMNDITLQHYCPRLKPGAFANLRVRWFVALVRIAVR